MIIENHILNETLKALSNSKGLNLSVYLEGKFGVNTIEKVSFYKTKLKADGYVTYHTLPDKSLCFYITPTGNEFIKSGGYPENLQDLALKLIKTDQVAKPISKVNQYDQLEIKEFVDEVTQIKDSIQHRILVMEPSELRPILIKLEVIIKDYFGKDSMQFESFARAKKLRYKGRVISVLTKLLAEEEIRYKKLKKSAGESISKFAGLLGKNKKVSVMVPPGFITGDRLLLRYVKQEIGALQQKIEKVPSIEYNSLRAYDANLKNLLSKVFLPTHKINKKPYSMLDKAELLGLCNEARNEIEVLKIHNKMSLDFLHKELLEKCEKQFFSEDYSGAVMNVFKVIEVFLKKRFELRGLTGMKIMEAVFAGDKPLIIISDDKGIQTGFTMLYKGAIGAIRNEHAHYFVDLDENEALDLLHTANYLYKTILKKIT